MCVWNCFGWNVMKWMCSCLIRRERSKVPYIVRQCIEEVEKRGIDEVGIYRISGVATDIQALKAAFDTSKSSSTSEPLSWLQDQLCVWWIRRVVCFQCVRAWEIFYDLCWVKISSRGSQFAIFIQPWILFFSCLSTPPLSVSFDSEASVNMSKSSRVVGKARGRTDLLQLP